MGSNPFPFWLYIPLVALALLGVVLLYFGLFLDRARSRRRCPKCWYDMSGAPPACPVRCPECGHVSQTERDLMRRRRRWWLAALGYLLMIPLLVFFALRDGSRAYYAIMPKWELVEEIRIDGTRASRYATRNPDDRGGRFVLSSNGSTLLDVEDFDIAFGQQPFGGSVPGTMASGRVGAGENLNTGGKRYLVAFAYSGGAHCCYTAYVVDLSDPPQIIATIDARNGMGLSRAMPGDPHYPDLEFNIADQSFDYWNASHAESPFPSVWYRIESGSLRIALDKMIESADVVMTRHADMRPPGPGPKLLSTPVKPQPAPPRLEPDLWSCMLDLLYSGNEEECWRVFEANWPKDFAGPPTKSAFKQEFLATLNKSPQWQDFQAARVAAAEGRPVPPATVGNYKPQPLSSPASPP